MARLDDRSTEEKRLPLAELRIVLLYIFFASLWIIYSDMALDWLTNDPIDTIHLQTFKGLNFVITTATLLYIVLMRSFNRWRRAEQRLRESQQRLSFAARATTEAIWDWDLASNRMWWSDGFYTLFGIDRDQTESTMESSMRGLHPEDRERAIARKRKIVESGEQIWADEYRLRRKDGTYAFVHDRGFVIRDAAGKAVRMVGGLSDISARKLAEENLERSRRQLRDLSIRLESLREEERTRISREIHDELGQILTGLKMDMRWMEKRLSQHPDASLNPILDKVVGASELVDRTIQTVQKIATELRPGVLDNLGLLPALRQEGARFQERTGITCQVGASGHAPALPTETATAMFRIFQEALTNIARHAQATEVDVTLSADEDHLVLTVADNGRGIRPAELQDPKSLGLLGMKERAELLGGAVAFQPGKSRGTVATLRLPRPRPSQTTINA